MTGVVLMLFLHWISDCLVGSVYFCII